MAVEDASRLVLDEADKPPGQVFVYSFLFPSQTMQRPHTGVCINIICMYIYIDMYAKQVAFPSWVAASSVVSQILQVTLQWGLLSVNIELMT